MASSINASTTAGVVTTADTSGVLNIQTAGTTAISIDASQAVSFTNAPTVTGGTANGVAYLNGSKVLTTGSALVFDGTRLQLGTTAVINGGTLSIASSSSSDYQLSLSDTRAFSTAPSANIVFGGKFNTAGTNKIFGYVGGGKENTTDGNNAGYVAFGTASNGGSETERARFNSTGALVFAGGTTTANGIGITFPATQSASTDANTLDDYEEGTWTPALLLTTGSITFSSVSGGYVKIGKLVYIRANFSGSATISSPTGDLRLSGLPFTAGQVGAGSTTSYNMAAGAYSINLETLAGTTTAYIFNFANGTRSSAHSYILAGSNLTISACYEV
jgi:hypothetical protein